MAQIFISYRRRDSSDATGRLYDRLRNRFGSASLFMDLDNILLGVDFRQRIRSAISESRIMLVIIGDDWIGATDSLGRPRLNDPNDYVRFEIETAMASGLVVVPVLVRSANMPRADQLPKSLHGLLPLNAAEVRSGYDFEGHIERLITSLETHLSVRTTIPVSEAGPSETAGDPVERDPGTCPKCGRRNPSARKFCSGCREPLSEPCFVCEAENAAWDKYCGTCGDDLYATREAKIQWSAQQREIVEKAAAELRFAEAISAAEELAAGRHPRLRDVTQWAANQLSSLKHEQAEIAARHAAMSREVEDLITQSDFFAAVERLRQIPPILWSAEDRRRLAECEAKIEQAQREAEESRRQTALKEAIEQAQREAEESQRQTALKEAEIHRLKSALEKDVFARDPAVGLPHVRALMSLVPDIVLVRTLVIPWLERVSVLATERFRACDFAEAVRLRELVPQPLRGQFGEFALTNAQWHLVQSQQSALRGGADEARLAKSKLKAERVRREKVLTAAHYSAITREAEDLMARSEFVVALERLRQVPPALRSATDRRCLAECEAKIEQTQREADKSRQQMALEEDEILRLKSALEMDVLARDPAIGLPRVHTLMSLVPDIAILRSLVAPWLERVDALATERFQSRDFAAAVQLRQLVPKPLRDPLAQFALADAVSRCELPNEQLEQAIRTQWTPRNVREARDLITSLDRYLDIFPHRSDYVQHRKTIIDYLIDNGCRQFKDGKLDIARAIFKAVTSISPSPVVIALLRLVNQLITDGTGSWETKDSGSTSFQILEYLAVVDPDAPKGPFKLVDGMRNQIINYAIRCLDTGDFGQAISVLERVPVKWRTDRIDAVYKQIRKAQER